MSDPYLLLKRKHNLLCEKIIFSSISRMKLLLLLLVVCAAVEGGKKWQNYKGHTLGYGCASPKQWGGGSCWAYCGKSWVSWKFSEDNASSIVLDF